MSFDTAGEKLVRTCVLSDLEEGEIFQTEIEGVGKLAVYLVEGEVYATDDTCTHGQASLAEDGYVEEFVVTCSWHDGAFDIRTGEPTALPCMVKLKTYPTTVRGDEVFITV
jgi:p-cumate 2,3-dioxygenase ferredoxin subunit